MLKTSKLGYNITLLHLDLITVDVNHHINRYMFSTKALFYLNFAFLWSLHNFCHSQASALIKLYEHIKANMRTSYKLVQYKDTVSRRVFSFSRSSIGLRNQFLVEQNYQLKDSAQVRQLYLRSICTLIDVSPMVLHTDTMQNNQS